MKKMLNCMLLVVLAGFFAVSCSKDCEAPLDLSNTTWADTAVINGIRYNPFKIQFNSNGTAVITIGSFASFNGSWNKSPNSNVVYFFWDETPTTVWKGEGTINDALTEITGTVTRTAPSVYNGSFHAKKQ